MTDVVIVRDREYIVLSSSLGGGSVAVAVNAAAQAVASAAEAEIAAAEVGPAVAAALGVGISRLSISTATALTSATHSGKWLVLTDLGNQLSLDWDDTGDGFACTVTNLTSYYCRPSLSGFSEALVRGVTLGIVPGGTASLFCVENGDDMLAFLTGDTA